MGDAEETSGLTVEGLPLGRLRDLAEVAATVGAAAKVGLFEALDAGPRDLDDTDAGARPEELARRLDLDPRAVAILLAALADLDLLTGDGGRYRLTDPARRHLADPESPDYEAGGLPLWLENLRAFASLPQVLERGGPLDDAHRAEGGAREGGSARDGGSASAGTERVAGGAPDDGPDDGLARFMAAMASAPRARIERLADRCLERVERPDDRALRLLDLGGGPGHMSRVFAERGVHAVLFDRPETVEYVAKAYDLVDEPSIELVGGDFLEDPLPAGPFDIALLSNVVHIYGPETNRRLLAKVARRVRPGGVVAVADFVRGRSGRAARFALVMLLHTEEGDTYTQDEIAGWLREAGLDDPRCSDIDDDRQVITAVRAAAEP